MKIFLKKIIFFLLTKSLQVSNKERGEVELKKTLQEIVPNLTDQYTTNKIDMSSEYVVNKIRGQHSFQMSIALKAFGLLDKTNVNIVDIGDSSGNHLIYLNKLLKGTEIKTLSVNLDPVAVDKIKAKGLEAILCKAEELHLQDDGSNKADIFLSYEMLEHLFSPIDFLHSMAIKSECEYFVATVPYVNRSRVALQFIRNDIEGDFIAENTHIFELAPSDWDLIFKFSGWEIIYRDKYAQYPKSFPLNLTKYLWRRFDFDGFYGVILKKSDKYSKRYKNW